MEDIFSKLKVFLYWDKYTWYALGSLSASLQQYRVPYKIIKGNVVPAITKAINTGYRVIYAESSRSWTVDRLKKRVQTIKESIASSNLLIVVGGPHATGAPEEVLDLGVEVVVIGEGEETFPDLIRTFAQKSFTRDMLANIPGIMYLDRNGNVRSTPSRSKIDLDSFCPYSDHPDFPIHPPIEIMRGCGRGCHFCSPTMRIRHSFPIDHIMKEVEINREFPYMVI